MKQPLTSLILELTDGFLRLCWTRGNIRSASSSISLEYWHLLMNQLTFVGNSLPTPLVTRQEYLYLFFSLKPNFYSVIWTSSMFLAIIYKIPKINVFLNWLLFSRNSTILNQLLHASQLVGIPLLFILTLRTLLHLLIHRIIVLLIFYLCSMAPEVLINSQFVMYLISQAFF